MDNSSDLHVGLVGAGGIAPAHLHAWRALGARVRLLDRRGAAHLAAEYGAEVVPTLEALIERSDVIDIISPTATHARIALAAIERGRHVVCEKPLAVDAVEARAMADAAADAGVHLFPAHVVRYFGQYARAKQQVDAGAVGELLELSFTRTVAAPSSAWFFDADAGGGLIRDLMIHDLDQALWLAGPAAEISASQSGVPASAPGSSPSAAPSAAPSASAEVEVIHLSGAVSRIRGEWAPAGTPFRSTADLVGTRGVLHIDSAPASTIDAEQDADPYTRQLTDFLHLLRSGTPARVTPEDGVAAVALVDAAHAALAAGHPIEL